MVGGVSSEREQTLVGGPRSRKESLRGRGRWRDASEEDERE